MEIEAKAPLQLLEDLSLFLRDQLRKRGFEEGPRVARMESGSCVTFVKDDWILSLELNEDGESGNALLRLESETDVPGLDEIWDEALIALGREFISRIRVLAKDSKKLERALVG